MTAASHDEGGAGPRAERIGLAAEDAARIVDAAARRYFATRRARVDAFVDRHFSFAGSAAIHRKALGWHILKAPLNITLAAPQLGLRLAALGARAAGARRAAEYLGSRNLLVHTAVDREIEWLIVTELLELPLRQDGRLSQTDALAETILSAPELQEPLRRALEAIGRHSTDHEFRQRLENAMLTYAGTRAAAAEITTTLMTAGAGAIAVKQATPGVMSLGPALAAILAHQTAVASFPLGTALGSLWYGAFPAAVSPALVGGITGGLLAVTSVAAAFAGILADPVQRRLGLHRRRLLRLIDALERQWREGTESGFTAKDPYVARLLDLFDLLGAAYRLAHG